MQASENTGIAEKDAAAIKERIEKVLSAILSDKYECVVKLKFERGAENERKVQG